MAENRFTLSVLTKLILMMMAIATILFALVFIYFDRFLSPELDRRIIHSLQLEAQVVGLKSSKAIIDRDDDQANQIISIYSSHSAVVYAAILLKNASLLGSYAKTAGAPIPVMDTQIRINRTSTDLKLIEPITQQNEIIGYIYVHFEQEHVFTDKTEILLFLMLLFLMVLVVSFLLAPLFKKRILTPVFNLNQRLSEKITSKNFAENLPFEKDKDFRQLSVNFNQILSALHLRDDESHDQSIRLKKLVEVRTKQLFKNSHYDTLTGLPNRYLLVDRLKQAISKSKRSKESVALLFLDLDRFKVINDNFGHQNGDQLLKEVARRFKKVAREGDTVARLGGDEFVFLVEHVSHPKDAARSAMRIIDCLNEPFHLQENILHVSTSIGISIYPGDGDDDKALLKNADISMYHAKKKGPGSYSYYSDEMNNASLERLAIEANLRKAIENKELKLVYQPQKRLKENIFRNVEALLRWENPELGIVSPGVFIPIAEETGMIKKIDLWVISESCQQIKKWNQMGLEHLTVAINVSAGHLISSTLLEHLKTEIIVNQINASQIEIEITEEVFVEQTERTIENLKSIKKLGAKIAIDDFGTGYSSLQYIQDFPADTLKLDGMFINKLETDKASQGIVRSTIILAHSLGLEIVAECVEDAWQLNFLEKNDCDIIQGYYLSKPLAPEKIPAICAKP